MTDDQRDEYTHTRKEKPVRIRAKKVQAKEKSVLLGMMGGQVLIRHDHFPFDATYTLGKEGESEAAREKLDPGMVALMVSKGLLWGQQPDRERGCEVREDRPRAGRSRPQLGHPTSHVTPRPVPR